MLSPTCQLMYQEELKPEQQTSRADVVDLIQNLDILVTSARVSLSKISHSIHVVDHPALVAHRI